MTVKKFVKITLRVIAGIIGIPLALLVLWIIIEGARSDSWGNFFEKYPLPPDTLLLHSGFPGLGFDGGSGNNMDWFYYAFVQSELPPEEILSYYEKRCEEADRKFSGEPNYVSVYAYAADGWRGIEYGGRGVFYDDEFEKEEAEVLASYPNREKIFIIEICKPGRIGYFN